MPRFAALWAALLAVSLALPAAAQTAAPAPAETTAPATPAPAETTAPAAPAPAETTAPAAPAADGTPTLSVGAEAASNADLSRRLAGRELLRRARLFFKVSTPIGGYEIEIGRKADIEKGREALGGLMALVAGQQERLGTISRLARYLLAQVNSREPDLDRYLAPLKAANPDLDFQDPQVLRVLRRNSTAMFNVLGGLLAEPSAVALTALVEPDLAARTHLKALQTQLARRGNWDPAGNERLASHIARLEAALAAQYADDDARLKALKALLYDLGVPVPNTGEGSRLLVDRVVSRYQEVLEGRNLPMEVELVASGPDGLVSKFLARLDERIAQLEAAREGAQK